MSDIQLVLTDFDGTVAELGKHEVSEAVREAVIACENQGVRMVPVTGRYWEMSRSVLELLGFEDLGVFDNGATIQNAKTGDILWSKWLAVEQVRQVVNILLPAAKLFDYTPQHDLHETDENEADRVALISEAASHIYAFVEIKSLDKILEGLSTVPDISYYTAPPTRPGFDGCIGIQVNHAEADKFHGVNALRDIVSIGKEHTLAIGDGDNDVPLFQNAAVKVAMGNATDLLKQHADHVVSSVDKDGFAEAMHRFVLK